MKRLEEQKEKKEEGFSKSQLLKSAKFRDRRDCLAIFLEDGKRYTLQQTQQLLKDFEDRRVD